MNETTASTWVTNLESMKMIMDSIEPNKEWLLMSPDGRVWVTQDVKKLFCILATHHPLLKGPQ